MKNILDILKDDGIVRIDNFLNKKQVEFFKNKLKVAQTSKGNPNSHYFKSYVDILLGFFRFNILKAYKSYHLLNNGLDIKLVENFFSKKAKIVMIDSYITKKSEIELLPWHCDMAYEGRENINSFYNPNNFKLKFLIYLTNVDPDDGCTSYFKKSHKITFVIRKLIYEKKILYEPYFLLEDLVKIVKKNYTIINKYLGNDNLVEYFLKNSEISQLEKFSFSSKAGDAILFNEGGIHKVSKTRKDRMIIRYLYSGFNV